MRFTAYLLSFLALASATAQFAEDGLEAHSAQFAEDGLEAHSAQFAEDGLEAHNAQFAEDGLEAHNALRNGDSPLKLSSKLCSDAQAYANQLAANDAGLVHATGTGQGENLYWGGPSTTAEDVVNKWYSEKSTRKHCMFHYTQVMWKDSEEFCMAKAESKSKKTFVVARYFPRGNFYMRGKKAQYFEDNVENGFQLPQGC